MVPSMFVASRPGSSRPVPHCSTFLHGHSARTVCASLLSCLVVIAVPCALAQPPVPAYGAGTVPPGLVPVAPLATLAPVLAGTLSIEPSTGGHGEVIAVWTVLNESDEPQTLQVPDSLALAARSGALARQLVGWSIAGGRAGDRVSIAPGQFRRFRYRVDLPPGVGGATVFRIATAAGELAAFADLPAPAAGVIAASSAEAGSTPLAREPRLDRLSSAISANEPVYLAFGNRYRRNARFQISFKYRFFNENGGLARDLPGLQHLYFGYTQSSLWDLEADSAPFRDSSYRPSLFYRNDLIWTSAARDLRLGLQGGLEHESNGREGLSSRSINTVFVRPTVKIGDPEAWHLTLGPKVYAYVDRTGNPDIARYRGHADLFASVGHPEKWQFAATVRRGTDGAFGSSLLEATYPLRQVSLGNLDGYFYFQYFNGYGESILDYNRRLPAQFRAGFSITRWP